MKTIPMIFNQQMVKALFDGRKTVTRRPVEPWRLPVECNFQDERYPESKYMSTANNHNRWGFGVFGDTPEAAMENYNGEYSSCAPYNQGDLIWVRETFQAYCEPEKDYLEVNFKTGKGVTVSYPATDELVEIEDMETGNSSCRKKPSIHMPRYASRLTLRVTGVRCEQLNNTTNESATKEGINCYQFYPDDGFPLCDGYTHLPDDGKCALHTSPKEAYKHLWNSIYSNWDENPWVWVIEFEVVHKNVDEVVA